MKKLLLSALLLFSCLTATAQNASENSKFPIITEDSLVKLYHFIDDASVFDLTKLQESYRYKSRLEPSTQNKEILLYIDEKLRLKSTK